MDTPMRFCMECGAALELRPHRDGGEVPWCPVCGRFRHPVYSTAVIMIVMDRSREHVILIQQYGKRNILVAGYVDQGESAEHACAREVREELGLTAAEVRYNRSEYLPRTNTLMLNFTVTVEEGAVRPNEEIDAWDWFTRDEARKEILLGSLAARFLNEYFDALEARS